jgi:hypothetical protein
MGTFENIYELQRLWRPSYCVRLELRAPNSCEWTVSMLSYVTGSIIHSWTDHDLDGMLERVVREYTPKPSPTFSAREIIKDIKTILEKYS